MDTKTVEQLEPGDWISYDGEDVTVAFVTKLDRYVYEVELEDHTIVASFRAQFDDEYEVTG